MCGHSGGRPFKCTQCRWSFRFLPTLNEHNNKYLVPFFLDVKNDVLALITEPSKDDYDNDVSDNCDHNFGTFDDFGVKNDQEVSNNMILMSKYKGKHSGKKGQKIRAGVPPPPFRAMPERKHFFLQEGFPYIGQQLGWNCYSEWKISSESPH